MKRLWVVLGTFLLSTPVAGAETPSPVADINGGPPASKPSGAVELDGAALFAADDGVSGVELWRSDGTAAGTRRLRDILPGSAASSPARLTKAGRVVFFTAANRAGARELWKTDGTTAGTLRLRAAGASVDTLAGVGNAVYFKACEAATGCELWRSDGTETGTALVRDIRVGPTSSNPQQLAALGNVLMFAADDGKSGVELWKSNGTRTGTTLVRDIDPAPVTSGKGSGHSAPADMVSVGKRVYFTAETAALGRELWTSDGTAAGTALVKELSTGKAGTAFNGLVSIGERLFFGASIADGRNPARRAGLWRTDGRAGTTVEVRAADSAAVDARQLTVVGRTLFFAARSDRQLWKAMGEDAVATPVDEATNESRKLASLFAAGGRLFFSAEDTATGRELWTSDGTPGSSALVGDIQAGNGSSNPVPLAASASTLFLSADDGAIGAELWSLSLQESARLTVHVEGTDSGWGNVNVTPAAGPDCVNVADQPATCDYDVAAGTEVTLRAFAPPEAQSRFMGWAGACTGTEDCTVTLDAAKEVTATFQGPLILRLIFYSPDRGWGRIEVTSGAPLPPCVSNPNELYHQCEYRFAPGTEVTLTPFAPPESMSAFDRWWDIDGWCTDSGPCTLVMDRPTDVFAYFKGPRQLDVEVFTGDRGVGIVDVSGERPCIGEPGPWTTCEYWFRPGTEVTLSAFTPPDSKTIFEGWRLTPECSDTGPCRILMDGDDNYRRGVWAYFKGPQRLEVSLVGLDEGWGLAQVSAGEPLPPCTNGPGGFQMCEYWFTPGTEVTVNLVAPPESHSVLLHWGIGVDPPGHSPRCDSLPCVFRINNSLQVNGTFRGPGTAPVESPRSTP